MRNEQNTAFVILTLDAVLPCFDSFDEAVASLVKNEQFCYEIQERSRVTERLVVAYKCTGFDANGEPEFLVRRNFSTPRKIDALRNPAHRFGFIPESERVAPPNE